MSSELNSRARSDVGGVGNRVRSGHKGVPRACLGASLLNPRLSYLVVQVAHKQQRQRIM